MACLQRIWMSLKQSLLTKYKMQDLGFLPSSACRWKLQLHLNSMSDESNYVFSLLTPKLWLLHERNTGKWTRKELQGPWFQLEIWKTERSLFNFKPSSLGFVVLPWSICIGEHSFVWSNLRNESSLLSEHPYKYFGSLILQAITSSIRSLPSKNLCH